MKTLLALLLLATLAACGEPDTRYFAANEVDAKPFPLRGINLAMPEIRGPAEYYGKLKLNVYISASGGVDKVDVVEAAVPAAFRDAAVKEFSEVRWEPARKAGKRVKSLKVIEVDFQAPAQGKREAMRPD